MTGRRGCKDPEAESLLMLMLLFLQYEEACVFVHVRVCFWVSRKKEEVLAVHQF